MQLTDAILTYVTIINILAILYDHRKHAVQLLWDYGILETKDQNFTILKIIFRILKDLILSDNILLDFLFTGFI